MGRLADAVRRGGGTVDGRAGRIAVAFPQSPRPAKRARAEGASKRFRHGRKPCRRADSLRPRISNIRVPTERGAFRGATGGCRPTRWRHCGWQSWKNCSSLSPVAPAREAGPRRRRVQAFSPWAKTLPQGGFTPPEDFKYPGPHGTRSVSPLRRRVSFWMPRKKPKRHQGAGSDERSALIFARPYPRWPSAISP